MRSQKIFPISYEYLVRNMNVNFIDETTWINNIFKNKCLENCFSGFLWKSCWKGDNSSEWEDVTSSVLHGSVLGPLLFTIFINDLPGKIKHECRLYADESKLIGVIDTQRDFDSMQSWAKTWQMTFNYDKCKVMHTLVRKIGSKRIRWN